MKLTNNELLSLKAGLNKLIERQISDVKVSYQLSRNLRKVSKVLKEYQQDFSELIKQFGIKDSEGELVPSDNGYTLKPETAREYHELKSELLKEEKEVDLWLLSLDKLQAIQDALDEKISGSVIYLLDCMLEE